MWDWSDNIELSLYNALQKAGLIGGAAGITGGVVSGNGSGFDTSHWRTFAITAALSFALDLVTRREGYLKRNKFKEAVNNGDEQSL